MGGLFLSIEQKILLAAFDLERSDKSPFTAEDLVIAAWQQFPDSFALQGYPSHPDSNRILTNIMGTKGLRGRGWIIKVGKKQYKLSEAGKITAGNLTSNRNEGGPLRSLLSRDEKNAILRLIKSRAFQKYKNGQEDSIIFNDACSFWDISTRSVANTLNARLVSTEAIIQIARQKIKGAKALMVGENGAMVTEQNLPMLKSVHDFMLERFQTELDIIRSRKDERIVG